MNQNNLIAAAAFTPISLQFPNSWVGHLPFAAWVIQDISPTIFVKLGTHSGNSYFSFCQAVAETGISSKCYAVDTWESDEHAGQYSDEIFAQVNAYHQEHYAEFSRLLRMTFDDAVTYFADESIELLHIDGLHTYEAVHHDFETWLPKLAPGAVVMFHDTNVRERNFGIWKLWEELQTRYPNNLEFVHSHGLGVLQLNNAPDDKRLEWLQPDSPEKQGLINYFAALGSRQLERIELNELKLHAANLNQTVTERDGQVNAYRLQAEQFDDLLSAANKQIASLNHTVVERDRHIAELRSGIVSRKERALEQDQQLKIAQALYAQMASSTSWRISLPLREAKRFLTLSPEQQAKRYVRGSLRLARRMYQALPLSSHAKEAHRNALAKYLPRLLLVSGSHPATIPELAASENDPAIHYLSYEGHEGRSFSLPDLNDYSEWVRRHDTLTDQDREKIKIRISYLHKTPLISVVMPVYNPPLSMLEYAIRSVQGQLYPNWELCIADDASTDVGVHKLLQRYAKNDSRIKVVFRKKNGHISATSNSALELVNGEYIALLDNDDLLSEHALFWVADAIVNNPDAGLIYSDEDKIDQSGLRFTPYFKSDWNPDLFLSHNMICHLGVYRTDLVKKLGGFREGYEGAQDYDLALRCTEQLAPRQIVHIPRVLYHWRSHPGSTALAGSEKNYALLAGELALNDHFARTQVSAKAELLDFGMYRVRYAIPTPAPLVSLIIPTRNGLDLIKQCIESIIAKTTYKNYEILIVDNNSDDPDTLNYFASLDGNNRIRIIRDERPFNYSALNNAAAGQARGEYLGLINNDIEVISPEWLEEMMGLAIQPGVGAVGACLWYPNDTLQHGGVITGLGGMAGHSHKHLNRGAPGFFYRAQLIQTLSAVTAACLVVKKSIYQEVRGLDEINLKVAFNDVDFCLRVREAGYRNVWTPYAELYHHESATRGVDDTPEKQLRASDEVFYMQKRWGNLLMNDPAYSPNLTLDREDFSYAWPPRINPI